MVSPFVIVDIQIWSNYLFLQSVSFDKVHENCWLKRQIFSDKAIFH